MKKREHGAGLVEYALIVTLICLVCVPSVRSLSTGVRKTSCKAQDAFTMMAGEWDWNWLSSDQLCHLIPDDGFITPGHPTF